MTKAKRVFLSPPHLGEHELEFVHQAFASNYIAPLGPMVDAFEQEFAAYTGIPHCLALSSGTAAMHLALRELGVGPGDVVLASTLTFIGSVTSVTFLGGSLVFVDSDAASWNMDPSLVQTELERCARLGRLPKAVIPTDLYGQCCDLARLGEICARYQVPVICDSAEAAGAWYNAWQPHGRGGAGGESTREGSLLTRRESGGTSEAACDPRSGRRHAGTDAHAAVFSFNGNKILTTSGGGMLASHDRELIEHARKLSQQARDPAPHYEHTEIGYNYRMSNILAAIGRGQLRVLDERVAAKGRIWEHYRLLLGEVPGITFMPEAATGRGNRWLTVIQIDPAEFGATAENVRLALEAANIESRPVWKPMHLQPVFRDCRVLGAPVSERIFRLGLCLPSGTAMSREDVERVAGIVRGCRNSARPGDGSSERRA